MASLNYKRFAEDMAEAYQIFSGVTFSEGGDAARKWQAVMASVADLARGYSDEKWKTYVHRLNACRNDIIDELMNASPENKQQRWDAYNKTFNERDDNVAAREAWTLHRLSNRLIHSTETAMRQQGDLEQNEADIDDYLEEYSELGKHIDRIGADFDRFKDYEDFVEQSKAALKKKNELTERLEAVPEGHLSEAGIQKNLKTLKETHKVLEKQDSTFRWQLGDMDEEIKAQEKIADAAKAEMEKVQSNADTIEEANRKEKEKLEEKKAERQEQMDRTLGTKSQVEKISNVIVNARTQQHQVENDLKDMDKQYRKTKGVSGFFRGIGGVFSKRIREENKKAKEDHEIKSVLESAEEANQLAERTKKFKNQFSPGDDYGQMMGLGKFLTGSSEKVRRDILSANPEKNGRSLSLYQEQQTLAEAMRKSFAAYQPQQTEWDKFNERMKSPEGMVKMAGELAELQSKQLTKLREQMDQTSVDRIESKYVLKRMNEDVISSAEQEIEEMQPDFKAETNRLSVRTMAVEQQAYEVKKTSLETKLASPVEKYREETQKLEKLRQKRDECRAEREENAKKLYDVSAQCRALEKTLEDRQELKSCEERIVQLNEVGKKLENFRAKADHLAWSGEYLQQEKLKIDENGRFGRRYMDKTADNIYFGLQSLHTTAMVGKKPGHRDTAEYRGMMDRYDALIAAGEEGLQGKSPEEIKQMLTELKTGAENYIRAKQAQKFQSFRHSPMRKMRLDFAQNLMKLCDESTKQLDKMNDRVKGVQRKYDTFCKPVVNKWGQKLKPDEAMSVIKENRAMMLEKARVKKQESPSRSMNA